MNLLSTSLIVSLYLFSFCFIPLTVKAEDPPKKEEPAQEKKTEEKAPDQKKPDTKADKANLDETIQYLKDRLKTLEATQEISAVFKEDSGNIVLRFHRGKTVMNLELDPQDPSVFFDLVLKDIQDIKDPAKANAFSKELSREKDRELGKDTAPNARDLYRDLYKELYKDLFSELMKINPAKAKELKTPEELEQQSREPKETREIREIRTVQKVSKDPELDEQQDELSKKLKDMIDALEHKEEPPPKTRDGQGVPPDALGHIYQAQKFVYAKNFKAALKEVERSLELGETAVALALKGTIHISLSERDQALKAWRRALELDATMIDVQKALKYYERNR